MDRWAEDEEAVKKRDREVFLVARLHAPALLGGWDIAGRQQPSVYASL